jgi:uncharacterized OB-fold protein
MEVNQMFPARYWREIPQRYRMEAKKCKGCGKIYFPPRLVCSECKSSNFEDVKLTDQGKLLTWTVIHVGPSQFVDQTPYAMGIVELDGGARLLAQIADYELEELKTGMKLRLEFRKIQQDGEAGILCYGYKFVPA